MYLESQSTGQDCSTIQENLSSLNQIASTALSVPGCCKQAFQKRLDFQIKTRILEKSIKKLTCIFQEV